MKLKIKTNHICCVRDLIAKKRKYGIVNKGSNYGEMSYLWRKKG